MKRLATILIFCALNISSAFSQAAPRPKKTGTESKANIVMDSVRAKDYYLELRGYVRQLIGSEDEKSNETIPLDSALVTIYNADVPYSEIWTNKKGKCIFRLPMDKNFKIEISKRGLVTKYIIVNTKIPNNEKDIFNFSFDVDLFEDVNGLDVSVLSNPIAKVTYNVSMGGFAYDVNYTSKINAELKKMYKNYYRLQKIQSDTTLFKADSVQTTPKKVQSGVKKK